MPVTRKKGLPALRMPGDAIVAEAAPVAKASGKPGPKHVRIQRFVQLRPAN